MQTVDEIIERFGRPRLRKLLGVTNSSLSDAISAGTFPARYYKPMKDEAEAEGWELPIDRFNWRQPATALDAAS